MSFQHAHITQDPPVASSATARLQEKPGVVYTKPWVVSTILDLTGYTSEQNLVDMFAVEPSSGDGAFALQMVQRLFTSCKRQGRPFSDCTNSLSLYELESESVETLKHQLVEVATAFGLDQDEATELVNGWVRNKDFLFDFSSLPAADFIVGNPPYIRLEELSPETSDLYRKKFATMVGRADVYIAFYEAALKQLKSGGVCAFICADRWMLNQYGAELRKLITSGYNVETIVEMHRAGAFESDVSAYPAITVIRRDKQRSVVVAKAETEIENTSSREIVEALNSVRMSQGRLSFSTIGLSATRVDSWFEGKEPWPCTSPERLHILKRLEAEFYPLESRGTGTKVSIGVATGADDIFITTEADVAEPSQMLPLAMADDTISGSLQWSGHYLVNPWNRQGLVNLDKYPLLKTYLESHKQQLLKRHIGQKNPTAWYRTIDRVHTELKPKPKLYIPDIKNYLNPILDTGTTYPHHNLYVVYSEGWDLEVLGGLLLSDVAQFFVECYGVRMRGGYLRFQAQYLRRIRVPRPQDIEPNQAVALTKAFQDQDRREATRIALTLYNLDSLPTEEAHD
jgi:adenine-specific DNA-methyltransferase